jgi:hypothetical protein
MVIPLDNELLAVLVAATSSSQSKKMKKVLFDTNTKGKTSLTSGGQQLLFQELQAELAMISSCYHAQREELKSAQERTTFLGQVMLGLCTIGKSTRC